MRTNRDRLRDGTREAWVGKGSWVRNEAGGASEGESGRVTDGIVRSGEHRGRNEPVSTADGAVR